MLLPIYIEIETSKKCNRQCEWCPVGKYNIRNKQELMNWQLFIKILHDLKQVNYNKTIALHNYNEPLLNERLYDEIAKIKQFIPFAKISIFTNGDLLTQKKINKFSLLGVDLLRVTIYPETRKDKPNYEIIDRWLEKKQFQNKYEWKFNKMPENKGIFAIANYEKMQLKIINPNIKTYNTRAGLITPFTNSKRIKHCNMTTTSAAIDYLGNFRMCCNILSEIPSHLEYIYGNLKNETFIKLWNSDKMEIIRAKHMKADWSETLICETCYMLEKE